MAYLDYQVNGGCEFSDPRPGPLPWQGTLIWNFKDLQRWQKQKTAISHRRELLLFLDCSFDR